MWPIINGLVNRPFVPVEEININAGQRILCCIIVLLVHHMLRVSFYFDGSFMVAFDVYLICMLFLLAGLWSCYTYNSDEVEKVKKGNEKSVCERDGRVFSNGTNANYPGCKSCSCCKRTGKL